MDTIPEPTLEVKPETIHSTPQYKGKLYGIELEIEADGLYNVEEVFEEDSDNYETIDPVIPQGWLREQEDSIQGVELISQQPFDFDTSVENINRVFADIERKHFIPTRTPRGSTHVHANVADLTWAQMRSFVMACAWAEPTLIELAGKGRKGNLFAQSYATTPVGWLPVIENCRKQTLQQVTDTHYMAISFYPMSYLGSVEFRMGPSSRTADEAIRWLKCIDLVVTAGREEEIGLEPPAFLDRLMSKMNEKRQAQLRAKSQQQAAEIFYALAEPYVAPIRKPRAKSSPGLQSLQQEIMDVQTFYNEYQSGLNSIPGIQPAPPSTLDSMSEQDLKLLWTAYNNADVSLSMPNYQPVPPTPNGMACDDPNCHICNPNLSI